MRARLSSLAAVSLAAVLPAACAETSTPSPTIPIAQPSAPAPSSAPAAPVAVGACSAAGFCLETPAPIAGDLAAVWAASGREAYAVGARGTVLRFDGTTWRPEASGTDTDLRAVWGSGPGDVFAVGDDGVIVHRAGPGAPWKTEASGTKAILEGVWGSGPADVFAVGWDGIVLHFDGHAWSRQASGSSALLSAVSGCGPRDVYAVGTSRDPGRGVVLHHDGASWSTPVFAGKRLEAVWCGGPTDVYVAGEDEQGKLGLWRLDGSEPRREPVPATGRVWALSGAPGHPVLLGMRGTSTSDLIRLGTGSVFAVERAGGSWRSREVASISTPMGQQHWGLWAGGPDEGFAVGWWGTLAHRDAQGWKVPNAAAGGRNLFGVSGRSASDLFAVGVRGTVLHGDGRSWALEPSGTDRDLIAVRAAAGAVAAVGFGGTLLVRDAARWRSRPTGTDANLWALWIAEDGALFAAGERGTLLRCDAARCEAMASGTTEDLAAVWGRTGRDVYAGGAKGTLLHYDGARWARVAAPVTDSITAIGGDDRGTVLATTFSATLRLDPAGARKVAEAGAWALAAGGLGEIVGVFGGAGAPVGVRRFDGQRWQDETVDAGTYGSNGAMMRSVWTAPGEVVLVGDGGVVIRRKR